MIVNTIAATTTSTGLHVDAELDTNPYPAGVKIPATTITELQDRGILARHELHGEWNYALHPDTLKPHSSISSQPLM